MARGLNGSANGTGHWPTGREGVEARMPGQSSNLPPAIADVLPAVVGLKTTIPENRRSAQTLGSEREGHGIVIDDDGLIVTIGYLIMEADTVTITDIEGNELAGLHRGLRLRKRLRAGAHRRAAAPSSRCRSAIPTRCTLRSEAYVAGLAARRRRSRSRSPAAASSRATGNTCSTTRSSPCRPIRCGADRRWSAPDGALLGVGSLLVQEALGPGAPAFPGNMYVPINRLKPIFSELVANGRLSTPPRPWLGIYTVEHMGQLVIGGISDGGPADRAGLQRGDVLHALNDEVLDDVADFYRKLWESGPAGTTVRLRMERDNDAFEVTVRPGDRARYHKYGSD